jgi:hypothetical protein
MTERDNGQTNIQSPIDADLNVLPAAGFPIAADAVNHWFRQRYHRLPTEQELGAIMNAMAQRETTPPS